LSLHLNVSPAGSEAQVPAVDQQALLASLHVQHELADRSVGSSFEGSPYAAPHRIDAANKDDVDLTFQV
jgi:hypothetical protein